MAGRSLSLCKLHVDLVRVNGVCNFTGHQWFNWVIIGTEWFLLTKMSDWARQFYEDLY